MGVLSKAMGRSNRLDVPIEARCLQPLVTANAAGQERVAPGHARI
jgi:hypothetical protein